MDPVIGVGSPIAIHFTLRFRNGRVVETSRGEAPLHCTVGDGTLHPGLEAVLCGLRAGEHRCFQLGPDTYGVRDPHNVHRLPRSEFPDEITQEPGTVVAFELPDGQAIPGMITEVSGTMVEVDFNHPLAGAALSFEVQILDVGRPVGEQE